MTLRQQQPVIPGVPDQPPTRLDEALLQAASPYVLRAAPGVVSAAILTVGDSVNGYRLAGIPDGVGAFDNEDGTFTLLVNHEIRDTLGVTRAHGAKGAFVSKWIVRKDDLAVVHGSDLIQEVATWNTAAALWNAPARGVVMSRFCSADLPPCSTCRRPTTSATPNWSRAVSCSRSTSPAGGDHRACESVASRSHQSSVEWSERCPETVGRMVR